MKKVPTKVHAALDYLTAIALIVIPLFFIGEADAAVWVPFAIGWIILLQAIMTDYEWSLADLIPMRAHLAMDAIIGIVLIASPWIWGFSERVWIPHVVVGVLEIGAAAMTERKRREPAKYPNPPRHKAKTT